MNTEKQRPSVGTLFFCALLLFPFVDQIHNLGREFFKIFIGPATARFNECLQLTLRFFEMAVYGTGFFASGRLASIAFPRLHRDALCFFQTYIFSEIPYGA